MVQDGPHETQDCLNLSDLPLSAAQRLPLQLQYALTEDTHHCSLLTLPFCYRGTAVTKMQWCSLFFPKNVYEPEKKANICIGFALLLVWWPHFSWNRDPCMTCSHRGNEHGKVRWILSLYIHHSLYCVDQVHLLRPALVFILLQADWWNLLLVSQLMSTS